MRKILYDICNFLVAVLVCCVVGFVIFAVNYFPMAMHKHAMERMVGHKVTWWDAYWTK